MYTMWVTGPSPRRCERARRGPQTWSTISAAVQLRRSPMWRVAQKGQPTAQPTWLLTQTVDRRRESARAGVSMATVSMVWPSARRQSSLIVSPESASDLGVDGHRRELELGGERRAEAAAGSWQHRLEVADERLPDGFPDLPAAPGGLAVARQRVDHRRPRRAVLSARVGIQEFHGTDEGVRRPSNHVVR